MKDINCDLGEGEPAKRTRALMASISSANIACGGHAGDADSLRRCLALCREFGVRAGAHPGFADRANFGRRALPISEQDLVLLILQQAGAFARVAAAEGVKPHHLKLHGALYHVVEESQALAQCYVETVAEYFPGWKVYAAPFGEIVSAARLRKVPVWREVFADRAYLPSGGLAPRGADGAVISSLSAVRQRVRELQRNREIVAVDGSRLKVEAETICVHADSPGAVRLAGCLAEETIVWRPAKR
jgi:UPF0271 protein